MIFWLHSWLVPGWADDQIASPTVSTINEVAEARILLTLHQSLPNRCICKRVSMPFIVHPATLLTAGKYLGSAANGNRRYPHFDVASSVLKGLRAGFCEVTAENPVKSVQDECSFTI